jgi:hypothetical protein
MSSRVIGIIDAAVPPAQRRQLPGLLTKAFQELRSEISELGFEKPVVEKDWIWDWNASLDGEFEAWLAKGTVGLKWPDSEGMARLRLKPEPKAGKS